MKSNTTVALAVVTAAAAAFSAAPANAAYNFTPDGAASLVLGADYLWLSAPVSGGGPSSITLYATGKSGNDYSSAYLYYGTEIEQASTPLQVSEIGDELTIGTADYFDYFTKAPLDSFGGSYTIKPAGGTGSYTADPVPEASSLCSFGWFLMLGAFAYARRRRPA